jgi:hypothetical protein
MEVRRWAAGGGLEVMFRETARLLKGRVAQCLDISLQFPILGNVFTRNCETNIAVSTCRCQVHFTPWVNISLSKWRIGSRGVRILLETRVGWTIRLDEVARAVRVV